MSVHGGNLATPSHFYFDFVLIILNSILFPISLLPRDNEAQYFIGKPQLIEFLCWLDYTNRCAKECHVPEIARRLAENIRIDLFEMSIEPMISILDINIVGFMLVLMAKIIRQIDAPEFCDGEYDLLVSIKTKSFRCYE